MIRRRVQKICTDPSRTKQSFVDECDINKIVARASQTGFIAHANKRVPHYGDYSNVVDFQTAIERVRIAEDQFNALPAKIRSRFKNDPAEFLAFVGDEKNKDEAIELGLFSKPEPKEPVSPVKAPEPPPKEGSGE